jgi:hypothetical protein
MSTARCSSSVSQAEGDLKLCAEVMPDDKAWPKLKQRVDLIRERQRANERKMAQRMFS